MLFVTQHKSSIHNMKSNETLKIKAFVHDAHRE